MSLETISKSLLAVLVVVAIVSGLMFTGGPSAAKATRRDNDRMGDLRALQSHVQCRARRDGSLPESLDATTSCGRTDLDFHDAATGVPYGYIKLSDTEFDLCATLENAAKVNLPNDFDAATGCLRDTWTGRQSSAQPMKPIFTQPL